MGPFYLYRIGPIFVFVIGPYINELGIIDSVSEDLYPIPICVRRLQVKASLCRQCCASCGDGGPVMRQHWVNVPSQRSVLILMPATADTGVIIYK